MYLMCKMKLYFSLFTSGCFSLVFPIFFPLSLPSFLSASLFKCPLSLFCPHSKLSLKYFILNIRRQLLILKKNHEKFIDNEIKIVL